MNEVFFIFDACDRNTVTKFYRRVLEREPRLHVPGMMDFQHTDTSVLGSCPRGDQMN